MTLITKFSTVQLYLDAGINGGTAVQLRISFDWTGDGTWERVEMWDFFTPNDLDNYERFYGLGIQNSPLNPQGRLLVPQSTLPAWRNLTNGVVKVDLWQALTSFVPVMMKTDAPDQSGQTSLITIPYITTWRPQYQGAGFCGQPALIATTGAFTSGVLTTSRLTTSRVTSGGVSGPVTSGSYPAITSGFSLATTGVGAVTTGVSTPTTGGEGSCSGFQCPDQQDSPCFVPGTGRCVLNAGQPTCVFDNAPNDQACIVYQPPSLCYSGTCLDGSCVASGGFDSCSTTGPDGDMSVAYSLHTVQFTTLILSLVTFLFW